ncbi:bacterial polymer biosynthesis protein, WecB/TagA/CpsF family [Roseovarius mucosus DSM 17069]|uniref:Bacterial polymer biosynthesis protein, WecB/TagA/CpsF family n=1 Tax=Roseovarius mucosus DSM 17069 TaxID=1288298 RepID=A0A0A0HKD3_9RHOB|nr:WecB/TagA/CpsF family glycosyltransferase [Roseovarius mucosus]KGM87336.1 bacterial polymer biosynthesis protein, WecB/TagA/CpsF family [Roseovarius mucosus DSM 17069]
MEFRIQDQVIRISPRDASRLLSVLTERLQDRRGFALATLNLDHLVKLRHDSAFLAAYMQHDLVVADGNPVVWLSRIARRPVGLVPGADMVVPIARLAAEAGVSVALVGSTEDALRAAGEGLCAHVPGLVIAARIAPPMGFDPAGQQGAEVIAALRASGAGLCLLALGAPRQEIFAARAHTALPQMGFASIGAGLDFIAGVQPRAPLWMRRLALEWLWRALSSPRRMLPRYARCAAILPGLIIAAWRLRR